MDRIDTNYLENYKKLYVSTCPKCGGTNGYCECWINFRLELKKIKARIPIKYRDFSFDKFTHPQLIEVKNSLFDYCVNIKQNRLDGNSLYLSGNKGLAKTASSALILTEALRNNHTAIYFESFESCLDNVYSDWDNRNKRTDESNTLHRIINYDFLVIDGVGEGISKTTTSVEHLRRAFRDRANSLLPTIFVAMVPFKQLICPVEKNIIDLFVDRLNCLEFKGFNYVEEVINKVSRKKKNG